MTSMIKTNVFFDFTDFQPPALALYSLKHVLPASKCRVCLIFIIHVGATCCVTSSTGNIMKIHARITLTVEFIRTFFFIIFIYV
jgi:hypothetical protein